MLPSIAWNAIRFLVPALVLPLPFHDVIICRALRELIAKVQKFVLKCLYQYFPSPYLHRLLLESDQPEGQLVHNFYASIFGSLILQKAMYTRLANNILIYNTYAIFVRILFNQYSLRSLLPNYLYQFGVDIYSYLFPIKINITNINQIYAERIRSLLENLEAFIEKNPETASNVSINDYVDIDPITLSPPVLPVKIGSCDHMLDAQSLRLYQKETCPMCRGSLDLNEYSVSIVLQEKVLKQTEELLEILKKKKAFLQLPFNQV